MFKINLKRLLICSWRDCRPDLETYKCVVCGKQFRIVGMGEYLGKIKGEAE